MNRRLLRGVAALAGGLAAAGCGGADDPDLIAGRGLIELHAAGMISTAEVVIEADGTWRARCDDETGARVAEGRLEAAALVPWRERVRTYDAPFAARRQLVVRQEPGPADYPVTTVNGEVEGGKGERLAEHLHAFASGMCRRGDEIPSRFRGPAQPLGVQEALTLDTLEALSVRGALVIAAGGARLCDQLLESFPPQCGQPSLGVEGLDPGRLALRRRGGVAWREDVTLRGVVRGDVLELRP